MKIAVYGTLKSGHGNNRLLTSSKLLGTGYITGHRLYQRGIPFVVPDVSSEYAIEVEVYEVDNTALQQVDRLEGHPDWYKREDVLVSLDRKDVQAQVYRMEEQPPGTHENITGVF